MNGRNVNLNEWQIKIGRDGRGADWSFLEIFPFVGRINFEGDRCTENIYRGGSVTAPVESLRLRSRKWINRGEGFDRDRVIYHQGLARETFSEKGEGGKERGGKETSAFSILRIQHFTSDQWRKAGEGMKADTRGKGNPPRGWILFSSRDNLLAARKWRILPGFRVTESAE